VKAVFLGTPEAAIPALRSLADIADVRGVFTQPDRPRGRSGTSVAPPVKAVAGDLGLEVFQPESSAEIGAALATLGELDVAVIVAYGMLIRSEALEIPRRGFVNVHFSVLPRWRGAAPVQRAMEAGDSRVGVTLMQLDEGLDTGPILSTRSTALSATETAADVLERLARDGAQLLREQLARVISGAIVPTPQVESRASHAPKVTGRDRPLDISGHHESVLWKIRALSPNPGATLTIDDISHKILQAAPFDAPRDPERTLRLENGRLLLTVGDGVVELVSIQPPGKKPMSAADWARGRHGALGVVT
jgi:methionyl-tRNA formyltransferase